MTGYRDTLNLPQTDFPMKADLPRREPERLRWWSERDLYRRLRERRRGRPVFLLHDGPPYSNGRLHLGTAANKIWKDAVVRSASLLGYDAPFVPGWDNHGMPIETQVAREFRERGEQPGRGALRRRCRAFAAEWVAVQRREFERLGIWGEWERPYLTMDSAFEAEILESFVRLAERGFIRRGLRSIHWCPTDRTALAEAEIEYREIPSASIHVLFPHRAGGPPDALAGVTAVAWTTTPWTLPANLGLMVDPEAEYVVAAAAGGRFLLAAARLAAVAEATGWKEPRILARHRGRDLVGAVFAGPWGGDSTVVDGTPFVSLDDGTGLVHTAPGHGKEDFQVGARAGLGVLSPVDAAGCFTAGAEPFVGRSVLELDAEIIDWLRARSLLLAAGTVVHSYPHCWRCRQPVIFRATEQWFMVIDHDGHRDRALASIAADVRWEPPSSRNRMADAVRQRPDWCLSRQRSWGVGIPAVYCGGCGAAVLATEVMRRAAAITRAHGSDAWYERPVDDFLPAGFCCPECGAAGPFRREEDILDVWFDSGTTHRAVQVTHPEFADAWARARAEGGRIVFLEGPDQHRGWFNSSLMVAVGIEGRAPYTDVLTHGWVLDASGRAMHKSLGNVVTLDAVVERYGADIARWWALSTDWRTDVRVGDEILERVADAYRKVRNTFRFLLGNLHDFDPRHARPPAALAAVDRVFAGHLAARLASLREDYRRFLFHRVTDTLLELCTVDLSAVFLDAAKDRLYTLAADDPRRRSAQTVLWQALHDLAIAASPALVTTMEEVWQGHPALVAEAESVHLADWPERAPAAQASDDWRFLCALRDRINSAVEPLRAERVVRSVAESEVTVVLPPAWLDRLAPFRDELAAFVLAAALRLEAGAAGAEPRATAVRTARPRCERCWTHRADVHADGPRAGLCARCVGVLAGAGT